jgi:DNA-binding CsgD family transcriptional regulator
VQSVTTSGAGASSRQRSAVVAFEGLSGQGLDQTAFRDESLRRLRSLLSVDAAFFASVDPATLLFTSARVEEPLSEVTALFLENEFGGPDVNKFAQLARSPDPVGSLDLATHGDRAGSTRYREILAPLGLGDELRVALVSGGDCWGVLCLHREASVRGFDEREVALLRHVGPAVAAGLRQSVALYPTRQGAEGSGAPGIVILDDQLSVVSINGQAERWLSDIADADWPTALDLPFPILAAAAEVAGRGDGVAPPPTRLRRASGGWLTLHASTLDGPGGLQVAVVLDEAGPTQLTSLVLAAHGLTPAQTRVAALVVQGLSTSAIVSELQISSNTLQEHLHAIFDKFGIGSRRELVAALSGR